MRYFNRIGKPVSIWLIVSMLNLYVWPLYSWAGSTESNLTANQEQSIFLDRERLRDLVQRQEVLEELKRHGVTEEEALARIDALTDEEVAEINGKLDQLPVGAILYGDPVFNIIFVAVYLIVVGVIAIGGVIGLIVFCPFSEKPYFDCITMGKISSTDSDSSDGSASEETVDDTGQFENPFNANCYSDAYSNYDGCMTGSNNRQEEEQCEMEKQASLKKCND